MKESRFIIKKKNFRVTWKRLKATLVLQLSSVDWGNRTISL